MMRILRIDNFLKFRDPYYGSCRVDRFQKSYFFDFADLDEVLFEEKLEIAAYLPDLHIEVPKKEFWKQRMCYHLLDLFRNILRSENSHILTFQQLLIKFKRRGPTHRVDLREHQIREYLV